jgi:3-methyladenine DNA glycosylase AlkD
MTKIPTYKDIVADLAKVSDKKRALEMARYFKTGKGEYGEGDIFIGVTVPASRIISKRYVELGMSEVKKLLTSKIHEYRTIALHIWCLQYARESERRKEIFNEYLAHTKYINNWDLVDTSAREIVGQFVWNYYSAIKRKAFLTKLAKSKLIWERRIAIVATHYGIMKGELGEVFAVATLLLKDTHDLMHKAVGWMLREVGKKDRNALRWFLDSHAHVMPRTMLRYALEHFEPAEKARYMKMKALKAR